MSVNTEINRITTEVATQKSLIEQLSTALDGKAAGGGSGGSLETCSVTFAAGDPFVGSTSCRVIYVGADGQAKAEQWIPGETVITVIKGSHIVVTQWGSMCEQTNANQLYFYSGSCGVYQITDNSTFNFIV